MKNILIIEDEVDIRDLYVFKLQLSGYNIIEAENAKIGLKKVQEQIPDLILLDIITPEMDGFDFLRKLRKQDAKYQEIPIFVISNLASATDKDLAQQLGCVDYIVKAQVTPAELQKRVDDFFAKA